LAVTDPSSTDHSVDVMSTSAARRLAGSDQPTFDSVYADHVDFVWRSVRRLGVPEARADDAVQDVFVVVYRRLSDFEGRSAIRTWLFGVARRVSSDYRRRAQKQTRDESLALDPTQPPASPLDNAVASQATRSLYELLDTLSDDQRQVFVLAELEEMSAPQIAEATGAKLNTVYSRLRLARAAFNQAVERMAARQRRNHVDRSNSDEQGGRVD
jgi:RNA polymerase sigma-70 factor (ECF subfamily)